MNDSILRWLRMSRPMLLMADSSINKEGSCRGLDLLFSNVSCVACTLLPVARQFYIPSKFELNY